MMNQLSAQYLSVETHRIFSLHHPALKDRETREGVVICPPAPFELRRSHRALRNLAQNLAKAGFHCLRFDYRGTSDSSGNQRDWTLDGWRSDIQAAVAHCREAHDIQRVSVVGLRLGASLAWQALHEQSIKRFVLWDPIFDGQGYLAQLHESHRSLIEREVDRPPFQQRDAKPQLLGFGVTPEWLEELRHFRLELPATARGVIVQSHETIAGRSIGRFKCVNVADDQKWANPILLQIQSFAHPCLAAIEQAIEGRP